MSNITDKPWLAPGHMYQYDIGWLIDKLLSFEDELNTAIDLKTIHYADPLQWDITTQYSPNTVVIDPKSGTAYMSKVAVPTGVQLSNTDYWVVIFNYQRVYDKIMSGVAFNDKDNPTATKDIAVNDLVWVDGDLYRATRALPAGTKYIPGTNLTAATVADCFKQYYGADRTAQLINDTLTVSGDWTVSAGDAAITADDMTVHVTQDVELDVDGTYSEHIDGVTTKNYGAGVTEAYEASRDVKVTDTDTEIYSGPVSRTYSGKVVESGKDYSGTFDSVIFHLPSGKVDLAHIKSYTTVSDYGARGDGKTDDSDAIMAMIAAVGYAAFKPGTYKCNLTLTTTTSLVGYDRQTTILSAADPEKDVVKVVKSAPYTCVYGLTMQDGANGLHIVEGIGNIARDCIFRLNTDAGLYIEGKNTTINSILTHIDACYAERNGKYGFWIKDFADWSMLDSEGVSNASSMGQRESSNLRVESCAGKVCNSHFWNFNDSLGYFRPNTSCDLNKSSTQFVNCHIEGGYNSNLSITGGSAASFVNCTIYASFGSISIWADDSAGCKFVACDLLGQAADDVSYKPTWESIFGGSTNYGIISDCTVVGTIFNNTNFKGWKIDANTDGNDSFKNVPSSTDVCMRGTYGSVNANNFNTGGGSNVNMNGVSCIWCNTATLTITGNVYPGKRLIIGNAYGSATTVTLPIGDITGSKTFTLASHKCCMIVFDTTVAYVIGA